jgi:hypothetical protein
MQNLKAAFAQISQLASYDDRPGIINREQDLTRSWPTLLLAALNPGPSWRIIKR